MNKEQYTKAAERIADGLPFYVRKFYVDKSSDDYSSATLFQYMTEYTRFFTWLIETKIVDVNNIKDIPLTSLEHLKLDDVKLYKSNLVHRSKSNKINPDSRRTLSHSTVNRSINALKSLWKYLTIESETDDGEPYFYRNVMAKITTLKDSETLGSRARRLKPKLYIGDDKERLLEYMLHDYVNRIQEQKRPAVGMAWYEKTIDRDVAMFALLLATGIRVSELVNLNVDEIDMNKMVIEVIRKGGKGDIVPIAPWSKKYIEPYLRVRDSRFKPTENNLALFLTTNKGIATRITSTSVELRVKKYTEAFGRETTPHKFRHSIATELMRITHNENLVATQLGQDSTVSTALYEHSFIDEQNKALRKI